MGYYEDEWYRQDMRNAQAGRAAHFEEQRKTMNEMFKRCVLATVERIDTPPSDPLLRNAGLITLRYLCLEMAKEHLAVKETEMARNFVALAGELKA